MKLESFTLHELNVTQINNLKVEKEKEEKCFETLGNWANGVFVDPFTRGAMSPWNIEWWGKCNQCLPSSTSVRYAKYT